MSAAEACSCKTVAGRANGADTGAEGFQLKVERHEADGKPADL